VRVHLGAVEQVGVEMLGPKSLFFMSMSQERLQLLARPDPEGGRGDHTRPGKGKDPQIS
jgi:hypothetical protein